MPERDRSFPEFFERLEHDGLSALEMRQTIQESDRHGLIELALQLVHSLPHSKRKRPQSFGIIANSTLSGGLFPCQSYRCREGYLDQTARYAALYADNLAIRDPLDHLSFSLGHLIEAKSATARSQTTIFRGELLADLRLLYHVRPLLEAGLVEIADTPGHFCPNCYSLRGGTTSPEVTERINDVREKLKRILVNEVPLSIGRTANGFRLEVAEHELLGHHSTSYHVSQVPADIANSLPVVGQMRRLSLEEARQSPHVDSLAGRIIDDVMAQNMYAATSGAHYLTDRPIDMEMIRQDERATTGSGARNRALMEGMAHSLPFLSDVPLDDLVELRAKEGDAFEVYRQALRKALEQSQAHTTDEVRQAVDDLVRPEVAKIELLVRNSKCASRRDLAMNGSVATGFITAALWSGMLPASIAAVVAAIGGFSGIQAMASNLPSLFQEPGEARKEQFYFLWRVKQIAKTSQET
jgi:hypothetical protein